MEVRLVQEELEKCHKTEGVNHYENCKWLSEKYLAMVKANKVCVACNEDTKFLNVLWFTQVTGYRKVHV
jgi:hypothetical protein